MMTARHRHPFASLPVVCFGDGRLPGILVDCMQFRLVSDRAAAGRAGQGHLIQLQRHVDRRGCQECRVYLAGRLAERRFRRDQPAR